MRCCAKMIFILAFSVIVGCAGVQPATTIDHTFEKVFNTPAHSKEQIFNGTKIWIAENFKSAKSVLEYENKDTGTIIGNGIIPYPCSGLECTARGDWKVTFTMRVDIKDQKFRLTFSNLNLSYPYAYNPYYSRQAYDGPIRRQSDVEAVKPVLLKFGDQLMASFLKDKQKSDW